VETETQVLSANGTNCLKEIETRRTGQPVIRRVADALFVMIGADAVTHWLPPQIQRENGYVRTGREVSDQPGWGGRSYSISAGNKSSGLLLCRRRSLQLDQARFRQRRRRQHGHCFRASISHVNGQTASRVIAVAFQPSLMAL